jgi:hypothetical protein
VMMRFAVEIVVVVVLLRVARGLTAIIDDEMQWVSAGFFLHIHSLYVHGFWLCMVLLLSV